MEDIVPQNPLDKQCTKCKKFFPATTQFFHRDRNRPDKLFPWCKQCRSTKKPSDIEPGNRRCSRCKNVFPETLQYFQHTPRTRDKNLTHACKECLNKGKKTRYWTNLDESRAYSRKRHVEQRDQENARRRVVYALNPSKYLEACRLYVAKPEVKIHKRAYLTQYLKEYYAKPEKRERRRLLNRVHGHKKRARRRAAPGKHTAKQIQEQYQRQRSKCYYCHDKVKWGEHHIEHVVPLSRGGSNDISNIVIACGGCNQRKHNKLPHEWFEGGRLM